MRIYHGSDHIINKPLFGVGKEDNDYGSGFYTTQDKEKAEQWALVNGTDNAICNIYDIDEERLEVLSLDDYGTLAWIAELAYHRGARGESASLMADKLIEKYKIDTSKADIIIGYRADDSYIDIVDAFLQNQLTIEEADRLFRKGNLGKQVFIKSEKAFNALNFAGYYEVSKERNEEEIRARIDVEKFLRNRRTDIQLSGYVPFGIKAIDAINTLYKYNQEYKYYEPSKSIMKEVKFTSESDKQIHDKGASDYEQE